MSTSKSQPARGLAPFIAPDGNVCNYDANGRLHLRAPRRADVALAMRLGAQLSEMQKLGEIESLPAVSAVSLKDRKV